MAKNGYQMLEMENRQNGMVVLWLDLPDRPLNVLNRGLLSELERAFQEIAENPACRVLVIASRKASGFLAGADLHEFAAIQAGAEAAAISATGQRLFDKLAQLPQKTVAVIHGPCLGGGLELALACDHRLVIDERSTQIGLPEIELGLLPAWGGTQRLPRTIGIERAMQVILMRKRLNAADAVRWGLADRCHDSQSQAIEYVRTQLLPQAIEHGKATGRRKSGSWRQRILESTPMGRWLLFRGAGRLLGRRVPDDMPAPHEALAAMRTGMTQGMADGLAAEREGIGRLATTTACRNLMTLFFLIERARKADSEMPPSPSGKENAGAGARAFPPPSGRGVGGEGQSRSSVPDQRTPKRIGIVGGGTMGVGIAQLAMIKGCDIILKEVNQPLLDAARTKLEALFQKAVANRVLSGNDARERLDRMVCTTDWQAFHDADLVIEAIVEDINLKRQVFQDLERHVRPDAILATNTSSLLVSQMQDGLTEPSRMAGLHFFNPVHKMPLVEVARTSITSPAVVNSLTQWAASLGKIPVVVGDSPGFIVNRILVPYLNEAGMLVAEGMPVEAIDRVMRRFGMPMGPLELLDQVGLDIAAHVAGSLKELFAGRLTPHPALERMCQHGWLGQKAGRGFYRYDGKKKVVDRQAMEELRRELGGPSTPHAAYEHSQDRMVCLMVNEAAMALSECLGEHSEDIDLAMVLGTGWAPHRGGPLRYADDRGIADIVRTLESLAHAYGPRFAACGELRGRVESNRAFYADLALARSA
jgi:3-hydroxyacyl-CoA dehydrogenase/enoyl-CoA hydratase/3-hydroxybutyryl-CoA epimerase